MKIVVLDWENRPRPVLKTPAKGEVGDRTDESFADELSVDQILRRYAGNLAVLAGWQREGTYGDQPIVNLEDAFECLRLAKDRFVNEAGQWPFTTLEQVFNAMEDGSFLTKVQEFNKSLNDKDEAALKEDRIARNKELANILASAFAEQKGAN